MRAYAALIILLLAACAVFSSLAWPHAEPPMAIDAQSPGVWPKYAQAGPLMPGVMMCQPILTPRHNAPKPIVRV